MIWGRRRDNPGAAAPRQSAPAVPHSEGGGDGSHGPRPAVDGSAGVPARRRARPVDGRPGRLGGALVVLSGAVVPDRQRRRGAPAATGPATALGYGDDVVPKAPVPRVPAPAPTWATPSVIVRRPDGSVVPPPDRSGLVAPGSEAASVAEAPAGAGVRCQCQCQRERGRRADRAEPGRTRPGRPGGRPFGPPGGVPARGGAGGRRSAVPAYGLRRGAASPAFEPAGLVTATASGAASRAAARAGSASDEAEEAEEAVPNGPTSEPVDEKPAGRQVPEAGDGDTDDAPAEEPAADASPDTSDSDADAAAASDTDADDDRQRRQR